VQVGLPEAHHMLAQAVVLLSTAPKSNSASGALGKARMDIQENGAGNIPDHLRDGHYPGAQKLGRTINYKYAHDYPGHYVEQQYLPDSLADRVYYEFGGNKSEQAAKQYREWLKSLAEDKGRGAR
jgi:putative ATPase